MAHKPTSDSNLQEQFVPLQYSTIATILDTPIRLQYYAVQLLFFANGDLLDLQTVHFSSVDPAMVIHLTPQVPGGYPGG